MTLINLITASMLQSDNIANNKVMKEIGGVKDSEHELRTLGDNDSDPQRLKLELSNFALTNTADTMTPKAVANVLNTLLTNC